MRRLWRVEDARKSAVNDYRLYIGRKWCVLACRRIGEVLRVPFRILVLVQIWLSTPTLSRSTDFLDSQASDEVLCVAVGRFGCSECVYGFEMGECAAAERMSSKRKHTRAGGASTPQPKPSTTPILGSRATRWQRPSPTSRRRDLGFVPHSQCHKISCVYWFRQNSV